MYLPQVEVHMKKNMRRCQNCGCLFEVCNKVKKHEYCNKEKCQRARKRKWQKQKIKNDKTYRKDQKEAQEANDNQPFNQLNERIIQLEQKVEYLTQKLKVIKLNN